MGVREKLSERARRLKAEVPAVWLCLRDDRTPLLAKALAGITVVYALSPVDLIPDFVPVLGYLDDVIVLPALIALTLKLIPHDVWQECLERSEGLWEDGKPERWYYAIPVLVIWALVLWAIASAALG